jgi:uncharacterized spore protein YtfJ
MEKSWTLEEISILKEKYENSFNSEIERLIPNRSYKSITLKASKLGLKKSKEVRSLLIGKRNKKVGRDLTFERIKEIASGFKSRGEFQKNDPSAYITARVNGWLESVCLHMVSFSYSTPQVILYQIISSFFDEEILYDDRKAIKPLELDIFIPSLGIAFEYDGNYWHKNDKNDKIEICKDKKIKLFKIKEKNRQYEKDIKNQIIDILPEINFHAGKNITPDEILDVKIDYKMKMLNLDEIKETCLQYSDLSEFSKMEPKLLRKITKMKLLKEFTSHMKRKRRFWTDSEIKEEISKFEFLGDLIKNNFKVYLYCTRNRKDLLGSLKSLKPRKL